MMNFLQRAAELLEEPEVSGAGLRRVLVENKVKQHAVGVLRRHFTNLRNETLELGTLHLSRGKL